MQAYSYFHHFSFDIFKYFHLFLLLAIMTESQTELLGISCFKSILYQIFQTEVVTLFQIFHDIFSYKSLQQLLKLLETLKNI